MDFAELLDATEAVTVEFLGKTIVCNVFTAGTARLTNDERERLSASLGPLQEAASRAQVIGEQLKLPDLTEERTAELETELAKLTKEMDESRLAHICVPLMVRDFQLDGEKLEWRGEAISEKNIHELPLLFLVNVSLAARDVWLNPTNGAGSESSAPPEKVSQAESTPLSASSEAPLVG